MNQIAFDFYSAENTNVTIYDGDPLVNTRDIGRALSVGQFTTMFDQFLNCGGKQFGEGQKVGLNLRHTHRTLQRQAIAFAMGIIVGLSKQEYTDPRNADAIAMAKEIATRLEEGQLSFGLYI